MYLIVIFLHLDNKKDISVYKSMAYIRRGGGGRGLISGVLIKLRTAWTNKRGVFNTGRGFRGSTKHQLFCISRGFIFMASLFNNLWPGNIFTIWTSYIEFFLLSSALFVIIGPFFYFYYQNKKRFLGSFFLWIFFLLRIFIFAGLLQHLISQIAGLDKLTSSRPIFLASVVLLTRPIWLADKKACKTKVPVRSRNNRKHCFLFFII